ncbi:hypothetical protein C6500_11900 [Candidatus Poribacteria bacterium]|nr:MAG: hypothetical protein C6500_11900 [Candidatus Poribacteria bacterium]
MKSIILRGKIRNSLTLLITILGTIIGSQLSLQAGTDQFLFDLDAIKDPGSLIVKLQDTRAPVSKFIASQLSEDMQWVLLGYNGTSTPSAQQQKVLLSDLNRLLQASSLYEAQRFADIELSEQTQILLTQNPQSGEALVRLNRCLLADAYPYELASLSEEQTAKDIKGIETCRENLRQIKRALDDYRAANADAYPQWISDLSPQYLEKKVLLCPADPTAGAPGVLTEDASDPTLPCSYLYELRPSEKEEQQMLWTPEGGMIPIIRCEHHRLNLSLDGKLYRNGPQRDIYDSNKIGFSSLADVVRGLREQHGDAFLKSQEGRESLKQATEEIVLKKFVPKLLSALEHEIHTQLEAQLGKDILKTPMGMNILKEAIPQVENQIKQQLKSQLQAQLGEEFLKTEEGQDILQQLADLISL